MKNTKNPMSKNEYLRVLSRRAAKRRAQNPEVGLIIYCGLEGGDPEDAAESYSTYTSNGLWSIDPGVATGTSITGCQSLDRREGK